MKNKIEIYDDITEIFMVNRSGKQFSTIIDTKNLPKINNLGYSFNVNLSQKDPRYKYAVATVLKPNGTKVLLSLHRLITDCPDDMVVDHINHDTLDNREVNLRVVTKSENSTNKNGARSDSRTGIRGIELLPSGRYRVRLLIEGVRETFGTYNTLEEAKSIVKEILEPRGLKY